MLEMYDARGYLVGEAANSHVQQVVDRVRQRLECLTDSGATVEELKAYTCTLIEEITWAARQTIIDRDLAIKRKEGEDA